MGRKRRMAFILQLTCLVTLAVGGRVVAGMRADSSGTRASQKETPWTVEDTVAAEEAEQFRISPDGQWAVWVKQVPDADKDEMVSNLFMTSLVEKLEIQLTRGPNHDVNPKWSRDGQLIAFLSDRPLPKLPAKESDAVTETPKPQLWLMNARGGEAWPLTRLERAVKDFDWVGSKTVLMAAEEDLTLYERHLKEQKDDSRAVEDLLHTPPVRLFKVNAQTAEITRFTTNDDWTERVEVSPDGKWAVAIHQRSLSYEFDEKIKPVTFLYDLTTGRGTPLFQEGTVIPWGSEFPPQIHWTSDSTGFYVASLYSTHPVYHQAYVTQLYYYDLAAQRTIKVDLGWENGLGLEADPVYAVTPDGFVSLLAAGVRYRPARYTREGYEWKRAWLEGEDTDNIFSVEVSRDGRTVVYRSSTASRPTQWYRATLDGSTLRNRTQLTDLNPTFYKKVPARREVIRWKGWDGEEVEGILYFPKNYESGRQYPLVVMLHGGPLSMDMDEWDDRTSHPRNLYAQRGAFVLEPNYHGSGNYGLRWAESIGGGKYYDLEVPDIEKGVDYLIARGLVDRDRLAAMGWSNGAILTIALTVNTTRYKAASAGAGDVEQVSDWAYSTFGAAFDNYYFGAAPIEDPQLYIRKSPLYKFMKVRTPTIIFSGTEDRAVGHAQAWEHFRTLQQLGQTDVRFVAFPGEPHDLRKISHRRRKVEEELTWFDKYLFQLGPAANEAVKPDSPIAHVLKRRSIKRAGTSYGVLVKSTLVPELVLYHGLQWGRFEVTRAQYAAFDKNYKIEPGTENFPANGLTFADAQAYCFWLSELTGERYHLGKEEELGALYKGPRENENTLDYWAGYNVNPDDAARLQSEIVKLGGPAPLLKEVGSFEGRGEDELVFDLGGNVAEWVMGTDGRGEALGGSADRPADSKGGVATPSPAYVGFRVIKDSR